LARLAARSRGCGFYFGPDEQELLETKVELNMRLFGWTVVVVVGGGLFICEIYPIHGAIRTAVLYLAVA
jgi:hypothetical protein